MPKVFSLPWLLEGPSTRPAAGGWVPLLVFLIIQRGSPPHLSQKGKTGVQLVAGALAPWYLNGCLRQSRLAGVPCILWTVDGGQNGSVRSQGKVAGAQVLLGTTRLQSKTIFRFKGHGLPRKLLKWSLTSRTWLKCRRTSSSLRRRRTCSSRTGPGRVHDMGTCSRGSMWRSSSSCLGGFLCDVLQIVIIAQLFSRSLVL